MLGLVEVCKVPATNNAEVNAAVGMQDYQVNGAIMALKDVEPPMLIDLLEWQQPRDDSEPYANLYRPGLARLAPFVAATFRPTTTFYYPKVLRCCLSLQR